MAKNDFFVIACRVLAYLYACMKEGQRADETVIGFEALGIPQRYWVRVIGSLHERGYITGVYDVSVLGSESTLLLREPEITMEGIEFLQNNSMIARAMSFLKDLKEIIPGI